MLCGALWEGGLISKQHEGAVYRNTMEVNVACARAHMCVCVCAFEGEMVVFLS